VITLLSFGYKHGIPEGAAMIFDCRHLRNPHRRRDLRYLTGLDGAVRSEVMNTQGARALVHTISCAVASRLSDATFAVGCYGGNHRSVAIVEEVAREAKEFGWPVSVVHRDLRTDGRPV